MEIETTKNSCNKYARSFELLNFYKQGDQKHPSASLWHTYFVNNFENFYFENDEFDKLEKILIELGYVHSNYKITREGKNILRTYPSPNQFKHFHCKKDFYNSLSDQFESANILCEDLDIESASCEQIVNELKGENKIEVKDTKFGMPDYQVRKKSEELHLPFITSNTINNSGVMGDVQQQSFSHRSSDNDLASPITQTISKITASTPIKRSSIEVTSWIAGILIAIITIYQIFF